jgi:formylglycine-generating enzyme required for sulfatase activity
MTHDVFVSHSSKDKPTADAVVAVLESRGIRCWVAPRDILPGADWSESIIDALYGTKAMVLIFSDNANASPQIKREVERAVNNGTPVIPLRIENVVPTRSLENFISTPHWLDAFAPPLQQHLEYLADVVTRILKGPAGAPTQDDARPRPSPPDRSGTKEFAREPVARADPPPDRLAERPATRSGGSLPRKPSLKWMAALAAGVLSFLLAALLLIRFNPFMPSAPQPSPAPAAAPQASVAVVAPTALQALAALPAIGSSFRDCADCPQMVVIPLGRFMMGLRTNDIAREGISANLATIEGPRHEVTIGRSLAIGKFTVTVGEFAAFVRATGREPGKGCNVYVISENMFVVENRVDWRNPGFAQANNNPVICVSWDDAQAYAAWLSQSTGKTYRLPSEAEWEYAARAGTQTVRYWGDGIGGGKANCRGCDSQWDGKGTAPVGSFAPNAFGLYDMLGNVFQYTADCWNHSYQGAPSDGSVWLSGECALHAVRGGSWVYPPPFIRAAARSFSPSDARAAGRGLRVVRTE